MTRHDVVSESMSVILNSVAGLASYGDAVTQQIDCSLHGVTFDVGIMEVEI